MALLATVSRLLSLLSLHLRLFVLRFLLFMRQTVIFRTSPARASSHKLLLLGDAVALGLGDTATSAGLATRLPALLRDNARDDPAPLRLSWHVLTAAVCRSTAPDWLPGAPRSLFENALVSGPFRDADVVAVILGAHDDLVANGEDVVNAVATVAEGVVRLGKHCLVATFANEFPVRSPEHAKVREANQILRDRLHIVSQENTAPGCGTVSCDVEMAKVFALGNDVLSFENDFITPNASGYRLLAREVYEAFVPAAKKVEWTHWKQKLSATR